VRSARDQSTSPRGTTANRSGDDAQVRIKGTQSGLSVTLGEGYWGQLLAALEDRLLRSAAFFRDSRVNLSLGDRELDDGQLRELVQLLEAHHVSLARVHTSSRLTAAAAQTVGVRIGLPEPDYARPELPMPTEEWSEGLLYHRTLRSGQSLRQPGHIIVIGNVNSGAEIVAGGDVLVWGRLRGAVHAGASGNETAVVCALELRASILRIAETTCLSSSQPQLNGPAVASLSKGQIVILPWTSA
jgi:septum site-determining protein MinC